MRLRSFNHATTPLTGAFRLSAISVGLAAAVLAGSAIPASAAPGDPPVVSFIDWGPGIDTTQAQLRSSALDGSGAATSLTSPSVNTSRFSVSTDGSTVAVAGNGGPFFGVPSDRTYGVLVAHRVGGTTETRQIATRWQADPVVSPNGAYVYFLDWIYSPSTSSETLALYKYNVTSHATARITLHNSFQPSAATGTDPDALAVSPDGSKIAIVYRSYDAQGNPTSPSRMLAGQPSLGTSATHVESVESDTTTTTPVFSTYSLAWSDDNATIAYAEVVPSDNTMTNFFGTVGASPATGILFDYYNVTRFGSAWWMWKDNLDTSSTAFASITDPIPTVEPPSTTTWVGNYNVDRFRLSSSTPAVIGQPTNRPAMDAFLVLSNTQSNYNRRLAYDAAGAYFIPQPGQSAIHDADITQRGVLEYSYDKKTFRTLLTTTAANRVAVGGETWLSYTPPITRTVHYRWRFLGSAFAAPSKYSAVASVTMIPTVFTTVKKVGTKSTISGTATRVGGSVTLYRVVGSKATKVSTKTMNSKGQFSFGTIYLKAGNYRISTVLDTYAGIGSKTFKV